MIPPDGVDYVSVHDAIHEIGDEEDKESILAAMSRILKPGGVMTYNSAFTTAALEESAVKWGRWKSRAFSLLGGKRDRKAKAIAIHSPEEYKEMISQAGLSIVHEAKRAVKLSRDALGAISRYPAFVEGVFGARAAADHTAAAEGAAGAIGALSVEVRVRDGDIRLTEVDAARELAHHHQVHLGENLRLDGGGVEQFLV